MCSFSFRSTVALSVLGVFAFGALSPQELPKKDGRTKQSASDTEIGLRKKAAKKSPPKKMDPETAADRLNVLVGDWRGIGQPKRSSRRGAWIEKSNWQWRFAKGKPADKRAGQSVGDRSVVLSRKSGKLFEKLSIWFDPKTSDYALTCRMLDSKAAMTLRAKAVPGDRMVFVEPKPKLDANTYRFSFRLKTADRVLLLVERGRSKHFRRVAEISYQRQGTSLKTRGRGEPECIVTGGAGTIKVSYKGRTYFVCCSGCAQAFKDDPEGIIAAKKEADAKKKAKARKGQKEKSATPAKRK